MIVERAGGGDEGKLDGVPGNVSVKPISEPDDSELDTG
jgi:hypothetical protein